jgi:hypothetical protein
MLVTKTNKTKKKPVSRKKLTKEFTSLYVHSLPHWRLAELCEKYLRKKLNKLSETDFVEKLEDETFGDANVHSVAQWELFNRYIEQQNAKKKRS